MVANDNLVTTMPVAPANGGFGGGFGGDWGWIILLLLFAGGGWGNNGGFGGGYDFPWLMNGQQDIMQNSNNGFQNALLNDNITSVRDGIAGISTQLCGGFAGVNASISGAQNALAQQLYTNQIADLERSYNSQTAQMQGMNAIAMNLQNCCCENRQNIADLKYTVATENCADRAAVSEGVRDIIASQTAGTQRILDQLCQDKIDAKNDTIAQLRQELMFARGQASQDVQTAALQAGQRTLANEVEQYVAPRAIPSYTVQNPNCCTNPCGYNCGCGVG
jgi:hypothetical protein